LFDQNRNLAISMQPKRIVVTDGPSPVLFDFFSFFGFGMLPKRQI
jgi:hypothetical protein